MKIIIERQKLKKLAKINESFTFSKARTQDINKIIKLLNPIKATGTDGIILK